MRFFDREITDIAEWPRPVAAHHWAEERSAYELARDWLAGADRRVEALLSSHPMFGGEVLLHWGVGEHASAFDANPRGPRHHDLLVGGICPRGRVVIGVEGKADEPLDRTLSDKRMKALADNARSGQPARIDALCRAFFGATPREEPALGVLRYQLLSALAGTLVEANRDGAMFAVVLVHEFVTTKTDDAEHAANRTDLDAFCARLLGPSAKRVGDHRGWVAGPATVHGDGIFMPEACDVLVASLVTRRR